MHEYHLRIDQPTKNIIKKLSIKLGHTSISDFIVELCKKIKSIFRKLYYKRRDKNCRYSFISPNKGIQRTSLHVYMPDSLYQTLKNLHSQLNFYSIAQCVRHIIHGFIYLIKEFAGDWSDVIKKWKAFLGDKRREKYTRRNILRDYAYSGNGDRNPIINFSLYFQNILLNVIKRE